MTTPMISALPLATAPTPEATGGATAPTAGFGAMLAAALAPATLPGAVPGTVPAFGRPAEETDEAGASEPETGDATADPDSTLLDAFLLTNAVTGTVATPTAVVPAQAPALALAGLDQAAAQQVVDAVDGAEGLLAPAPGDDAPALPGATLPAPAEGTDVTAPVVARGTVPAAPQDAAAGPSAVIVAEPDALVPVAAPVAQPATEPADPAAPLAPVARVEAPAGLTALAPVSAPVAPTAVTPTVSVTPAAVVDQIAPHVTSLAEAGPGVHRLSLTLDPAELGQVRVVLVQRHDEMHVVLSASEGARAALQQGSPELRRLLDAVGLPEARVTITDSGAGGASDQRGGQASGESLRDQAPRTFVPAVSGPVRGDAVPTRTPVTAAVSAGLDLTI
ncbi:flagellar hook-length control protein FliK [Aeromicrobium sp. IC_218]|uniref:flagellar hook-length control protein FliK n=1 Tax=Aeromicrobium sp. IC_218 TaxID=2545468 RepID=UPI00103A235B|nr:flagellar hook-length control protein FliK [Aeromicrobium sp. IC_218]TCJ00522.1 flagellar hook-length control protein FliK [Aeromicrobium sp. IC_218]